MSSTPLVDVVVVGVAVDQQEHAVVAVARPQEAAHADARIVALVSAVEAGLRAQRQGRADSSLVAARREELRQDARAWLSASLA